MPPQKKVASVGGTGIDQDWKAQGYTVKGFSDGSPDWGVGAMASYAF